MGRRHRRSNRHRRSKYNFHHKPHIFSWSLVFALVLLLIAYMYSQSMHFFAYSLVYGFTPAVYWVIVGVIALAIYFIGRN